MSAEDERRKNERRGSGDRRTGELDEHFKRLVSIGAFRFQRLGDRRQENRRSEKNSNQSVDTNAANSENKHRASVKISSLKGKEINQKLKDLPNWKHKDNALVRMYTFPKYLDALEFVYKVGHASESANHHPDIFMNYKRVTLRYWTHRANGVTTLDFMMAKKVETILAESYHKKDHNIL